MRQRSSLILSLAVVVLAGGTVPMAGPAFGKELSKLEMASMVSVTIEDAIKTASEKVSGKVIEAELENKHHMLVWEVEIVTPDNKIMEVHIDAKTGAVIDIEEEKAKSGGSSDRGRE